MNERSDRSSFTPSGWHTLTPRIVAREAEGLVEFVKDVFGATGDYRPDMPTVLSVGDSIVMISDAGIRDPAPAFLYVYVKDADQTYRRALEAGARSKSRQTCRMATVVEWWRTTGAIFGRLQLIVPPLNRNVWAAGAGRGTSEPWQIQSCPWLVMSFHAALLAPWTVAHDVEDDAVRVADEKAAHPPRFVRQRVHHGHAPPHCLRVDGVHVGNLDRHLGHDLRRGIVTHDGELRCGVRWRRKRHDPAHVHRHCEPEKTNIELPTLIEVLGLDIGDDPPDAHGVPHCAGCCGQSRGRCQRTPGSASVPRHAIEPRQGLFMDLTSLSPNDKAPCARRAGELYRSALAAALEKAGS